MDMPADDAVEPAPSCVGEARLHEAFDVAFGRPALPLQEVRQRPIAQAEATAQRIRHPVAVQDHVVKPIPERFLKTAILRSRIVVIAVRYQQPPPIEQSVDHAPAHAHLRQHQAAEATDRPVVVARHVNQFGTVSRQRMQGLDHAVLRRAPDRALLRQPPQVNDIADEIELAAVQARQELRQLRRMAVARAQVHVGDEHRAQLRIACARRAHAASRSGVGIATAPPCR